MNAARQLGRAGCLVSLLDKRNFQLFQPLLYQVATGSLTTGDIAIPQRVVLRKFPKVQCLTSTAFDFDPVRKRLMHEFGELDYDTLIVATGVKHHYFGRDEWREFAPGLKTVEHAIEMRRRIFSAFELAEVETDPAIRKELMTFVIVGGGPTGVELAGAIGELANKTMVKDFRNIDPRQTRILLVEGASEILPAFAPKLRAAARRHLEELGVTDDRHPRRGHRRRRGARSRR
ncbi:MAG: NAD(P)/FAD-dependent oxidoreductase [Panacagrimonas sp.]